MPRFHVRGTANFQVSAVLTRLTTGRSVLTSLPVGFLTLIVTVAVPPLTAFRGTTSMTLYLRTAVLPRYTVA